MFNISVFFKVHRENYESAIPGWMVDVHEITAPRSSIFL
jgi:hypothetical protein